MHMYPYIKG